MTDWKTEFIHRLYLITEDRNIHLKALELCIAEAVFTIDDFLEKVTAENPTLIDYKTLSVRKEYFGNININDPFFESFKEDYDGFEDWFNSKADEIAYICQSENNDILAFLYVKVEGEGENYRDINPVFTPKRRLKIGTFKVISNGFKLGERFLKIVFDNALNNKVDEIYVTIFHNREEHERLIGLFEDWGFAHYGMKSTASGDEKVYIKNFKPTPDAQYPKQTYPFIKKDRHYFIVPIYPQYHTELFPDSILNNESPQDYVENAPHRNAMQKVYISRSINRNLEPGDVIIFYRTGGRYKGVISTIGIVESIITDIKDESGFISLCRKRSVFSDKSLSEHWNYNKRNRPFIVNFLYVYSLPKRIILDQLIKMGIIADIESAPRGFKSIPKEHFEKILETSNTDESFIIN